VNRHLLDRGENDQKIRIQLLCEAGCFAIVIEKVPAKLAKEVAKKVKCPIIGIGAGNDTDGQVLVVNDMLGMDTAEFKQPRFVRKYANLQEVVTEAVQNYISDVKSGDFPNNETEAY
jgi:3-methyl-2-oxobutanoate hydroxymethyltransferase